jgi:hypothetical protein
MAKVTKATLKKSTPDQRALKTRVTLEGKGLTIERPKKSKTKPK